MIISDGDGGVCGGASQLFSVGSKPIAFRWLCRWPQRHVDQPCGFHGGHDGDGRPFPSYPQGLGLARLPSSILAEDREVCSPFLVGFSKYQGFLIGADGSSQ